MGELEALLEYVRKTNPKMDKNKLIEEMRRSQSSAICLVMTWMNARKK